MKKRILALLAALLLLGLCACGEPAGPDESDEPSRKPSSGQSDKSDPEPELEPDPEPDLEPGPEPVFAPPDRPLSDFDIENDVLIEYFGSGGDVAIPEGVTSIGDDAFNSRTSLTSVTIPDSVTSIGDLAFASCISLASVTIGDGVTSIGDHAFFYCTSLTSVTIGNGVTSIGDGAFVDCESLASVTIPDSVTSIGSMAFAYCTSLTDVYYGGTQEQWAAISIGFDNDFLINATIHYNSAG